MGVEGRHGQGRPDAFVQRSVGPQDICDRGAGSGHCQTHKSHQIAQTAARTMAFRQQSWQAAQARDQSPLGAVAQISERKCRWLHGHQAVAGVDGLQIAEGGTVAAQDDVVAVVDQPIDRGVVERAATAAGAAGGLVDANGDAGLCCRNGAGESGQPGPDDVQVPAHGRNLAGLCCRRHVLACRGASE